MAILIEIKDKKTIGDNIYYTVYSADYKNLLPFKVGINVNKKYIYFFRDLDSSKAPEKVIDLNSDKPIGNFKIIPNEVASIVIKRILRCFRENEFASNISFSA